MMVPISSWPQYPVEEAPSYNQDYEEEAASWIQDVPHQDVPHQDVPRQPSSPETATWPGAALQKAPDDP